MGYDIEKEKREAIEAGQRALMSQGNPVDPQKGKVTDPLAVR